MPRAATMLWSCGAAVVALVSLAVNPAQATAAEDSPSFSSVPALSEGFRNLYEQKFPDARKQFTDWSAAHGEEPFGQIAIAASFLFEEFYRQGVLTSDFFLNDKKFLKGIEGKPDANRMKGFEEALTKARRLSTTRLTKNAQDPDALFCLTMADGMESDANSILEKKNLESLKHMKEANEYAQKLLAVKPDAHDAYVAVGAANYIIGSLSGGKRFFLWFGGIHGDKELGMEQLQKTADNGRYLRPFAKILLALASQREKQNERSEKLLKELSEEFPASPLFAAEYAKIMGRPIPATMEPH